MRQVVSAPFAKVIYSPSEIYELDEDAVAALAASARDAVYLADVQREAPAIVLGDVAIVFPAPRQVAIATVSDVTPDDTLTVPEAAWILGVTEDWVRKLCQKGVIPARRGEGRGGLEWLIPARSLGGVPRPSR